MSNFKGKICVESGGEQDLGLKPQGVSPPSSLHLAHTRLSLLGRKTHRLTVDVHAGNSESPWTKIHRENSGTVMIMIEATQNSSV